MKEETYKAKIEYEVLEAKVIAVKGEPGTQGEDGVSPIIEVSKTGKVTTITITDAEGTKTATINDGNDGSGAGDMLKATYDTDDDGVVDNAEKVNNHTVLSDVPANAVFTDTTYTAGNGINISGTSVSVDLDTTISSSSTNDDVPSAKAVYDLFSSIVDGNEVSY